MNKNLKRILILVCLSCIFLILGNNILTLSSPDEVFYSLTAREMMERHTWATPYIFGQPQFEKPIFTYWLLRIAFTLFGFTSFAARLFPAIFGLLGVIALYMLGVLGFKDGKRAFISSLVLMSSALYIGLSRTVFTDMIFSVLVLFSLVSFYWGYVKQEHKGAGLLLFSVFSALAVLTKGPLGFLIPFLIILAFLLIKKDAKFLLSRYSLLGLLVFTAISFPWYILMIKKYGHSFTHEFFYNDHIRRLFEAEHIENDTWYFYPVSIIACTLPWGLYTFAALAYFFKGLKRKIEPFYLFLACWVVINFLIFQPAHSKLTSYIFPVFPAVALITGSFIYDAVAQGKRARLFRVISYINSVVIGLFPIALMGGMGAYAKYISSKTPVYILSAILFLLSLICLRLIFRRKLLEFVFIFSFSVIIVLFGAFSVHKDIEPYTSSKDICEYIMKNYDVKGTVLTSKAYSRGVRYYTGKDIAVLDTPGKNYFSPHPIPFLNNDELAIEFLNKQPVTYCVLKKNAIEDIQRIAGKKFKADVIKSFGNVYFVKVELNH